MKKLLGTLTFVILIAVVIWGGATWFFGQETEKLIKQHITESNESNAGLGKIDLIEYKNTSFTGARAITQASVGIPFIDDILADANIVTDIKHGPVILLGDSGVEFAASKLTSRIDLNSLSEDSAALVTELFGDKNPIIAEATVGYDETIQYNVQIPAFSQQGEANFAIDGLSFSGNISPNDLTGPAKVIVGEMHLQDPTLEVIIPKLTADLDIQGFIGSQMLGTAKISAPNVKLKPATISDIRFDFDASSSSKLNGDELIGELQLLANNVVDPSGTVKKLDLTIDYKGLSIAGLNELSNLEAKLNNLQKQLMWNMQATETPEGQEKMMDLIGQMEQLSQQMIKTFFDKVMIPTKAQIKQTIKVSGDKGNSTLNAEFIYTGSKDQQAIDIDKFMLGDVSGLLDVVAGTIDANIEKSMLPDDIMMILKVAAMQNITKDETDKFSLNASMTDGKVTLNGETMKFEDFIAKFTPVTASPQETDTNASLSLPEDIEQRIQAEGLTDEIMQDLAESDDVDPDVLHQMQELKRLMDSVDAVPAELPTE